MIALVAVLALMAPSASARKTHQFKEAFGSAAQPSFTQDTGLAVDQSNGDVLVIDSAEDTVSRYKPDGTPDNFSALGTNVIDGKDTADETPQEGLALGEASEVQVAVDNSSGPTAGNIYVTDASAKAIDIFDSTGAYVGQLTQAEGSPFGKPCGVAVDPTGAVYVGDAPEAFGSHSGLYKFVPTGNPPVNTDFAATIGAPRPCTIAAGVGPSAGYVFVTQHNNQEVYKFNSTTGAFQYVVAKEAGVKTVSVDPQNGHLYQVDGGGIDEYDVSGSAGARLLATVPPPAGFEGVAARAGGEFYASAAAGPNVQIFGPQVPLSTPVTGAVSNRAKESVTLNGTVDPEGVEIEECAFEYGSEAPAYGQTVPCAETPGEIGSGQGSVAVHADISGLSAASRYHFRLLSRNENSAGPQLGGDSAFATLGLFVTGASAGSVSDTSATLNGELDPNGEATTYHFEYGSQGPCDANPCVSVPVPDGNAGSGIGEVTVTRVLSGLAPRTTYHFRLVATNPSAPPGGVASPDATFTTYSPRPTFGPCPNDAFRTGPGANLPDCRAYEQASPVNKNGADVNAEADLLRASTSGDAITFYANAGLPGGVGAQDFPLNLARRVGGDWVTRGLLPPPSYGRSANVLNWTPDLAYTFSSALDGEGEHAGGVSFVVRDSSDGSLAMVAPPSGEDRSGLVGVSADGSKVFFQSKGEYTPGAATGSRDNFYVWNRATGAISLAGLIPAAADTKCGAGGPACVAPAEGSLGGPYSWWFGTEPSTLKRSTAGTYYLQDLHAVSVGGSRAYFTAAVTGQIYLREDAASSSATTTAVSASRRTTPDPNGAKPAIFQYATPDGARAFFTSCEKLTDDSTAVSTAEERCDTADQGQDLYLYEDDGGNGHLTDLTASPPAGPLGADVKGVVGIDDKGDYVYFVANGDLDGSGEATPGTCHGPEEATGACNLYLAHNGAVTFVARLSLSEDSSKSGSINWRPQGRNSINSDMPKGGRVSADGTILIYREGANLYRYSATEEETTCVSCNPTGLPSGFNLLSLGPFGFVGPSNTAPAIPRNLSADGNRVFFDTASKLVAGDVNGDAGCPLVGAVSGGGGKLFPACQDVYEWEAEGTGTCETAGGCLYLLSPGTGSKPSFFGDASASGNVAFIFTRDQLLPQDQDQLQDAYAVTVDGGLASQNQAQPPGCNGEECRGSGSNPPDSAGAGTAVFQGAGNRRSEEKPRRCPKSKRKVKVKGKTRCVAKKRHGHKRHNRHASQNRHANSTGRTSR